MVQAMKVLVWRAALLASVAFVFVVACNASVDTPNAAATAGSKDYPCGVTGLVCDVMPRWQDDTCCEQNDICPGPHAGDCMAGSCCFGAAFDPSPQYGGARDSGAPVRRARAPARKAQ